MSEIISIYITCPDEVTAATIARTLITEKLIACGNILPVRSIYPWQGEIIDDNENILIAKTLKVKSSELIKRVEELHPYEIPCIITSEVNANTDYANWLVSVLI